MAAYDSGALAQALIGKPDPQHRYGDTFNSSSAYDASQGRSGYNPDQLAQQYLGASANSAASAPTADDTIAQAQKLRQFNIDSAQPQIQTLQQGKTDLNSKYQDILSSIKGNQQQAQNTATLNTNNELARRGIVGGGFYDSQLTNASQQAGQPFNSIYAQTEAGQAQDQANIANQIGALQSGNPEGAVSSALNIGQLSQNASQFAQQNQIAQAQLALQQKQANYLPIAGYGVYDINKQQMVGGLSNPSTSTLTGPNGLYTWVP